MATPAASAWHRRRNVLITPASSVTSVRHSTSLRSNANPRSESQALSTTQAFRQETQPTSTWSLKENLVRPQSNQFSPRQFDFLQHLTAIFRSGTPGGIFKSAAATLFSIVLSSFFMSFSNGIMSFLTPTHKLTYSIAVHRFPFVLGFFRLLAAFLYALTLFSMQFLFSSVICTEMRRWKRHAPYTTNADRGRFRLRLLHAIGSMSGCVLQTILLAYVTSGPSLTPTAETSFHATLFPSWSSLSLHTITALLSGFFFSILWMWVEAHSMHHNPFCLSALRRAILNTPRILLLSCIPVICAMLPSWLIHLILTEGTITRSSDLGLWSSFTSGFGRRLSILLCTTTSLLSWNITSVLEHHVFAPRNVSYPGAGPLGLSSLTGDEIAWYRDRIMVISQRLESLKMQDELPEEATIELMDSLRALTRTEEGIAEFPGFLDASGDVWRSTLRACLTPIELFQESLREYNSSPLHSLSTSARGNRSLFVGPSRSSLSSLWTFLYGGRKSFSFPAPDMCIMACEVLAKVATSSYELDRFGVVHRTLPQLMRSLLSCKEQTDIFISSHETLQTPGLSQGFSFEETRVVRWCQKALELPSDFDMVVAVDDALTLAVHRIVGTFRSHMQSFVDGLEVSWDRSQDRLLQQFLNHES